MRTKGIGPNNLGMDKRKGDRLAIKAKKRVNLTQMTDKEAERQAKLKAVRENSIAMKEERAVLAKRARGSKGGSSNEELAVIDRLQESGRTRDIKKS